MTKSSPKNELILYNFLPRFKKKNENIWSFSRCKIGLNKKVTDRLSLPYFKRHIDDISVDIISDNSDIATESC